MVTNKWIYAKGGVLGFLTGFFLFVVASLLLTLVYHDELWLLFGCTGMGIAIGCASARLQHGVRQAKR
jgi:hypothetical protein